jgi:hypothetical protein
MFYRILAYWRFLKKSTNEHGVHSPFVFALVTDCFYTKTALHMKQRYALLKKAVIENNAYEAIPVLKDKEAFLLLRLFAYRKIQNYLELGMCSPLTSHCAQIAAPKVRIVRWKNEESTVGGDSKKSAQEAAILKEGVGGVKELGKQFLHGKKYDLVVFGNTLPTENIFEFFQKALVTVANETIFIFEGIHTNAEKDKIWNRIQEHSRVRVTIDIFSWGMVFFRKEQAKEHFTIRI